MRFTLYPIYWLSGAIDDEPFDLGKLPFDVVENVRIEVVSHQFRGDEFDLWKKNLGKDLVRELEGVEYALVHRYEPLPIVNPLTGERLGEQQRTNESETLVRQVAACLRLSRPMRQRALEMHGSATGLWM